VKVLRLRILAPVGLLVVALAVELPLALQGFEAARRRALESGTASLRTTASQLQDLLTEEVIAGDFASARRRILAAGLLPHVEDVLFADAGDRVVLATRAEWLGEPASAVSTFDPALAAQARGGQEARLAPAGDGRIGAYAPVPLGLLPGQLRASRLGVLHVAGDLSRALGAARADALRDAGRTLALLLVLALGLALALDRLVTRRVAGLSAAVGAVAAGDATARCAMGGRDELARLGQSFDAMADRLARDGAERRRAEEALRASEERYRQIVETSVVGIWVIDAANRTTFVNRRMAEMLGYGVDEMLGADLFQFMEKAAAEQAQANVERRRHGIAEEHEFRLRRKDGSDLWTEMATNPLTGPGGSYAGALAMVSDVSERKLVEAQLRQSQKLEAVGRLAGGVAHDFNNLLTAILGNAELLVDGLDPAHPLAEEAREIAAAGRRAAALTQQLLAFSRRRPRQQRALSLNELVVGMDRLLRRLVGEGVELVTILDPELRAVLADPGQVEQVILNLVVNARDAMPEGGRITVATSNVVVEEVQAHRTLGARPGPHVQLEVADAGVGMSPEVLSRLFEPFFTTKEQGRGTGLGLSSVYGIATQSGGHVRVESEPGKGTRFRILLPSTSERVAAAAVPTPAGPAPRGGETVLLAEDEPHVRALAHRVLTSCGYTVLAADNGEQALRLAGEAAERTIHALVTDVVMPLLGGHELAVRLRAARPGIRVLFISGYTDRDPRYQEPTGGDSAFLAKPFEPVELARALRELLDRKVKAPATGA